VQPPKRPLGSARIHRQRADRDRSAARHRQDGYAAAGAALHAAAGRLCPRPFHTQATPCRPPRPEATGAVGAPARRGHAARTSASKTVRVSHRPAHRLADLFKTCFFAIK
jgi:hypothetical protein